MARVSQSSAGRSSVNIAGPIDVESTGFDTLAPGSPTQIAVGVTSTPLLAANPNRSYAHIFNNSGQPIYIQYAVNAALNQGIKIYPNSLYTLDFNNLWLGSISAISAEPGLLIDILEGE